MASGDRESRLKKEVPKKALSEAERALVETQNGFRQYDGMVAHIQTGIEANRFDLKLWIILELNREAVRGLTDNPGSFRNGPIEINGASYIPPAHEDVPKFLEEMCEYVNSNWSQSPLHLSAYVAWRLNWIHPFEDGNGRTSRAVAYLVFCVRARMMLPGKKSLPERIAEDKKPYYAALEDADRADAKGRCDVSSMEALFESLIAAQVKEVAKASADRSTSSTRRPLMTTRDEKQRWRVWSVFCHWNFWTLVVVPIFVVFLAAYLARNWPVEKAPPPKTGRPSAPFPSENP